MNLDSGLRKVIDIDIEMTSTLKLTFTSTSIRQGMCFIGRSPRKVIDIDIDIGIVFKIGIAIDLNITIDDDFDIGHDLLPRLAGRMRGWVINGYHRDVGTPESLAEIESDLEAGRAPTIRSAPTRNDDDDN